jgi:hypothetical protein
VKGCIIENGHRGIWAERTLPLEVKHSSIRHSEDIGVYAEYTDLELTENIIQDNPTGVWLEGNAPSEIKSNTITQNETGIFCGEISSPSIHENEITGNDNYGIYINEYADPNLGDSQTEGRNLLYENDDYDVYNNSTDTIMAEMNDWGTVDPDSVEAHIWDDTDDPTKGPIDFMPMWDGGSMLLSGGPQSGEGARIPLTFRLFQNTPNPYLTSTEIRYHIPKDTPVSLKIYDLSGRLVSILVDKDQKVGIYTISWDGNDLHGQKVSSGIYFYRLLTDDKTATRKLVFLK